MAFPSDEGLWRWTVKIIVLTLELIEMNIYTSVEYIFFTIFFLNLFSVYARSKDRSEGKKKIVDIIFSGVYGLIVEVIFINLFEGYNYHPDLRVRIFGFPILILIGYSLIIPCLLDVSNFWLTTGIQTFTFSDILLASASDGLLFLYFYSIDDPLSVKLGFWTWTEYERERIGSVWGSPLLTVIGSAIFVFVYSLCFRGKDIVAMKMNYYAKSAISLFIVGPLIFVALIYGIFFPSIYLTANMFSLSNQDAGRMVSFFSTLFFSMIFVAVVYYRGRFGVYVWRKYYVDRRGDLLVKALSFYSTVVGIFVFCFILRIWNESLSLFISCFLLTVLYFLIVVYPPLTLFP